jgi:hypothetical protein
MGQTTTEFSAVVTMQTMWHCGRLRGRPCRYFDNRLSNLPIRIRELGALKQLFLHENPDLGLPAEVLGPIDVAILRFGKKKPSDPATILDYYFRIHPPQQEGKRSLGAAR